MGRGVRTLIAVVALTAMAMLVAVAGAKASCSVSKSTSSVNHSNQSLGIIANTTVTPNQVTIGGGTMGYTGGPFDVGGGDWETTYLSHWTLTVGLQYDIWVNFPSGVCAGAHFLGNVTAT